MHMWHENSRELAVDNSLNRTKCNRQILSGRRHNPISATMLGFVKRTVGLLEQLLR